MSCSRSVVLLNNALKIAVMKNGDLSLIQLGLDKEKREITESVIAIYQSELNLLSDVVNLLVKRAVFHKQISSVDELTKLTTEIASYCADEFKKTERQKELVMPDNVDFIQEQQAELLERQINAARVKHCGASALVCEECDAPIPAARRAAYPSATRCVSCQSVFEAKNKHYRRTA